MVGFIRGFSVILFFCAAIANSSFAQERFFTSSNRSGAEGARQTIQLQQETNRNISQDLSLTEIHDDVLAATAAASASMTALQGAIDVSLATAVNPACGNNGMLFGPSHTTAVGGCLPTLQVASDGLVNFQSGLKLGSVGNCDASKAGALRYEAAQKIVQFCDGTAWIEVGAAPATSGVFNNVVDVDPSTVQTSNAVTVSGFAGVRTATVTAGATIIVNGAPIGSNANVQPGDQVALRVTSSASFDTALNITFSVSSLTTTWRVTTRSQDTTPNTFTVASLNSQPLSTVVTSSPFTVNGFDGPLNVSVSGQGSPEVRVGAGPWGTTAVANPGNSITVRMTTAPSYGVSQTASVSVGSTAASWTVTTAQPTWKLAAFTTTGSFGFTPPAGTTQVDVYLIGGGGHGGSGPGAGGGGGGFRYGIDVPFAVGVAIPITVGSGGGGASSFGGTIIAAGGANGAAGWSASGGSGGCGSGGTGGFCGGTGASAHTHLARGGGGGGAANFGGAGGNGQQAGDFNGGGDRGDEAGGGGQGVNFSISIAGDGQSYTRVNTSAGLGAPGREGGGQGTPTAGGNGFYECAFCSGPGTAGSGPNAGGGGGPDGWNIEGGGGGGGGYGGGGGGGNGNGDGSNGGGGAGAGGAVFVVYRAP